MNLGSLILTKLGEHRAYRSVYKDVECGWEICQAEGCGFQDGPEEFAAHLASVITEAIGLEERLSNLWDDKFGGFVPLYRARGLESDPSEGE